MDRLKELYPGVPILGLTATATIDMRYDLARRLNLDKKFYIFQSSFNRKNHFINVIDLMKLGIQRRKNDNDLHRQSYTPRYINLIVNEIKRC